MAEKPQLTCFVIGPIGDPGSTVRAGADDLLKYIIEPCEALKELGYGTPIRADQLGEPGRITSQVIRLLMESDLVIADLTGNNANVYYELSLRHSLGKPAIHMAVEGTSLSFDLRDNRTIFYTMHARVAEEARGELSKQVRRIHSPGYKVTNPIVETAGITKLEASDDPEKKSMGHVLRALAVLGDGQLALQKTLADVQRQLQNDQYPTIGQLANLNHLGGDAGLGLGGILADLTLKPPPPNPLTKEIQALLDAAAMAKPSGTKVGKPASKPRPPGKRKEDE